MGELREPLRRAVVEPGGAGRARRGGEGEEDEEDGAAFDQLVEVLLAALVLRSVRISGDE